jgi:hypothetical protein
LVADLWRAGRNRLAPQKLRYLAEDEGFGKHRRNRIAARRRERRETQFAEVILYF